MHTLILGFDSFDPIIFERLSAQGKMPNLTLLAEDGAYAPFTVSDPPQTEVSWTSIASGADPGIHGIFDFVHRDPTTYSPFVSLLPTKKGIGGIEFVSPSRGRTLFQEAADQGFPATSLWWPATFPAKPESTVRTIPGLGTPDILGKLGVGTLYTPSANNQGMKDQGRKIAMKPLKEVSKNRFTFDIDGPQAKKGIPVVVPGQLEITGSSARLIFAGQSIDMKVGQWSPAIEVSFKMGLLFTVKAVTRALLSQIDPEIRLYLLPLQIHPLSTPWRYGTPPSLVKDVWKKYGPFLTLGWPQDTTGLEEGCMTDDQFVSLCEDIMARRERTLINQLDNFREGVLGIVFDDLDRIQHMFRGATNRFFNQEIVENWYVKLDNLVGRVRDKLASKARMLVLSDHGFSDFSYKVHLNAWLIDQHVLMPVNNEKEKPGLGDIQWDQTQLYAVGLNSLYINLIGREGQGIVLSGQILELLERIRKSLLEWRGPDGRSVVQRVMFRDEVFHGPLASYGPDLLIGYAPGYRASGETGLGQWKREGSNSQSYDHPTFEINADHWGADHCIDSKAVPGVFFSNMKSDRGLASTGPSFRDIPRLAVGKDLVQRPDDAPLPGSAGLSGEDQQAIEERLKGLGYL